MTSVPTSAAGRTNRSATGSPPSSRRFSRSTRAPIRPSATRKPVRVGFTPTFSMSSSPPSASTAAATRNAALDASPGTERWKAGRMTADGRKLSAVSFRLSVESKAAFTGLTADG